MLVERRVDVRSHGRKDGRTDGRTDGWTNGTEHTLPPPPPSVGWHSGTLRPHELVGERCERPTEHYTIQSDVFLCLFCLFAVFSFCVFRMENNWWF